jgi:hypothetical protein
MKSARRYTPVESGVRILSYQDYGSSDSVCHELVEAAYRVHNINSRRQLQQHVELAPPILHLADNQIAIDLAKSLGKALAGDENDSFAAKPDVMFVDGKKAVRANRNTEKAELRMREAAQRVGITVFALDEEYAHILSTAGSETEASPEDVRADINPSQGRRLGLLTAIAKSGGPTVFLLVPESVDQP